MMRMVTDMDSGLRRNDPVGVERGVRWCAEGEATTSRKLESTAANSRATNPVMIRSIATVSFWFSYPLPAEATARLI